MNVRVGAFYRGGLVLAIFSLPGCNGWVGNFWLKWRILPFSLVSGEQEAWKSVCFQCTGNRDCSDIYGDADFSICLHILKRNTDLDGWLKLSCECERPEGGSESPSDRVETKHSLSGDSLLVIEATSHLWEKDLVLRATPHPTPFTLRKMTWELDQGKFLHLKGQEELPSDGHVASCLAAAFWTKLGRVWLLSQVANGLDTRSAAEKSEIECSLRSQEKRCLKEAPRFWDVFHYSSGNGTPRESWAN